ncbi:MAG: hypothetical protein DI576_01200 [Actinomyces sp.]|nr:MAG: hypothetical protein DI576_01200 [Actinomyces sp.]
MAISVSMSWHALERARQRGIDTSRIEDAINDPASQMPADGPGKRKYVGRPHKDGTQLVVIASDPPSPTGRVTIVTCYYRSQS